MTDFTIHADCDNSPKKLVLRDLNVAFAEGDVAATLDHFTDNIHWQIVGEADLRGKEAVRAALEAMKDTITSELVIHSIITHGPKGVVNGVITTEQGGAVAFCDVYRFASTSGTKIESMMSYAIEHPTEVNPCRRSSPICGSMDASRKRLTSTRRASRTPASPTSCAIAKPAGARRVTLWSPSSNWRGRSSALSTAAPSTPIARRCRSRLRVPTKRKWIDFGNA
ncbi:MAG: nuclear transport factor 2 family protein [Chloroflexi bacterium]|nr:nuclear transport factor 2 family protein [Chloroflexota bacterium]